VPREIKIDNLDNRLEAAILDLLRQRGPGKTICPSEVARRVAPDETSGNWRSLMGPTRSAAARLVAAGEILAMQSGRVVDVSHAKGPIRLQKK
jgi:hypothetical protein